MKPELKQLLFLIILALSLITAYTVLIVWQALS